MKIGILALQGGFAEHISHLQSLGVTAVELRKKSDLQQEINGLILPGGESTTIGKLLNDLDMFSDLKTKIDRGLPVFGTCAGMILLARQLAGSDIVHFGAMDIVVKRNAYGRQLGSFFTENQFKGIGTIPMTFIRAPYIEAIGADVEILSVVNDKIVAARQKNYLVTAFHPELTDENRVHRYFLEQMV